MAILGLDAALDPFALTATTVNVYCVVASNPLNVIVVVGIVLTILPGLIVTRYKVIGEPPVNGCCHDTTIAPYKSPGRDITSNGASGTVDGVMALLGNEGSLDPPLVFATTVNVYMIPFVSPEIIAR